MKEKQGKHIFNDQVPDNQTSPTDQQRLTSAIQHAPTSILIVHTSQQTLDTLAHENATF